MNNDPGSTGDRKLSRRSLLAAFGIGVAAAGLAGCSSAESVTTPTPLAEDPTPAASETPTAPATETPQGAEPTAESIRDVPEVSVDESLFEGWDEKTREEKVAAAVECIKSNLPEGVRLEDFPEDEIMRGPVETAIPEMLKWLNYYIQVVSDLAVVNNDVAKKVAEGLSYDSEKYDLGGDVARRGHFGSSLGLLTFVAERATGHQLMTLKISYNGGSYNEGVQAFLVTGTSGEGDEKVPYELIVTWISPLNEKNPTGVYVPGVYRCCSTQEGTPGASIPVEVVTGEEPVPL